MLWSACDFTHSYSVECLQVNLTEKHTNQVIRLASTSTYQKESTLACLTGRRMQRASGSVHCCLACSRGYIFILHIHCVGSTLIGGLFYLRLCVCASHYITHHALCLWLAAHGSCVPCLVRHPNWISAACCLQEYQLL